MQPHFPSEVRDRDHFVPQMLRVTDQRPGGVRSCPDCGRLESRRGLLLGQRLRIMVPPRISAVACRARRDGGWSF